MLTDKMRADPSGMLLPADAVDKCSLCYGVGANDDRIIDKVKEVKERCLAEEVFLMVDAYHPNRSNSLANLELLKVFSQI